MKACSIASTLVRGEMDNTVIDPGNGPKPSEQGASVANKGKAKRSRRGKKHKRDGKPRDASALLHDVAADVPAGSSYVSALEPDAEPRKRKRRRRSRGKGASQPASAASLYRCRLQLQLTRPIHPPYHPVAGESRVTANAGIAIRADVIRRAARLSPAMHRNTLASRTVAPAAPFRTSIGSNRKHQPVTQGGSTSMARTRRRICMPRLISAPTIAAC